MFKPQNFGSAGRIAITVLGASVAGEGFTPIEFGPIELRPPNALCVAAEPATEQRRHRHKASPHIDQEQEHDGAAFFQAAGAQGATGLTLAAVGRRSESRSGAHQLIVHSGATDVPPPLAQAPVVSNDDPSLARKASPTNAAHAAAASLASSDAGSFPLLTGERA